MSTEPRLYIQDVGCFKLRRCKQTCQSDEALTNSPPTPDLTQRYTTQTLYIKFMHVPYRYIKEYVLLCSNPINAE